PPADADRTTAAFHAGVNHYGLVDVYADRLDVRVVDLDGAPLDRFSVEIVGRPSQAVVATRRPGKAAPRDVFGTQVNRSLARKGKVQQ
ncbi:MAG TPA: hypothetical protein PK867_01555, partial [Pirellulales bacterium]|nr:hypothetical protein [Pirellulales bacterium]